MALWKLFDTHDIEIIKNVFSEDLKDKALKQLQGILSKNEVRLNRAIGAQTGELNWRQQMSKNLANIAAKMAADYKVRRDVHGCSPERMSRARTETERTLDWYDASVSTISLLTSQFQMVSFAIPGLNLFF